MEINEKLLKTYGFKRKWLSDKSGYWFGSKKFKLKDISCFINVNDFHNFITLNVFIPKNNTEIVKKWKYSDENLKKVCKQYKRK